MGCGHRLCLPIMTIDFSTIGSQPVGSTNPTVAIPFSSSAINPFSFIRRLIVPGNQAGISAYPIDFPSTITMTRGLIGELTR